METMTQVTAGVKGATGIDLNSLLRGFADKAEDKKEEKKETADDNIVDATDDFNEV